MKKFFLIFFLFYPILSYSQGWSLEYSAGYGSYKLKDIRSIQRLMLNSTFHDYGLKEIAYFPNYITHSVAIGFDTGHHHFGSSFSYLTTGGRLHRADYSGSFKVDMIMNGYRLGAFYRYYFDLGYSPLMIYLQLGSGVIFSELKMTEQVHVYSVSEEESIRLNGIGGYIEPSFGAKYRFTDWLYFSLGGGYEFDFQSVLKYKEQKTLVKANWDGLRINAGLIFIIPTKKN